MQNSEAYIFYIFVYIYRIIQFVHFELFVLQILERGKQVCRAQMMWSRGNHVWTSPIHSWLEIRNLWFLLFKWKLRSQDSEFWLHSILYSYGTVSQSHLTLSILYYLQDIINSLEERLQPLVEAELSVLVDVLHRPELLFMEGTEAYQRCESGGFLSK